MRSFLRPWDEAEMRWGSLGLMGLAAIFIAVNAATYSLVQTGTLSSDYLWSAGVWLAAAGAGWAALHRWRPGHDAYLYVVVVLLLGWGVLLVERLAPNFATRQVIWCVLGIGVLVLTAVLPRTLRPLRRYRYSWLLLGLVLLAGTLLFGVNPIGFGARLWLKVPFLPIYFQPSELLKLLLVIFLAGYFSQREQLLAFKWMGGRFGPLPYLAPLLLMWGFCIALLVWQRDLGPAVLFFIVFMLLLYLATGEWVYMVSGLGLLAVAAVFAYYAFDLVALRIDMWLNPWPEADDRAFQIVQSLYALAAGGVLGEGIGQGAPTYVPVVHSDFAFAAIGEEWGLIGTLGTVACFGIIVYRGMRIAMMAQRPFRIYLAAGLTTMLGAQALLIMGGVTRLLPLTGVTLPFVSYGGSSLLLSSVMVGLLLFLSVPAAPGNPDDAPQGGWWPSDG